LSRCVLSGSTESASLLSLYEVNERGQSSQAIFNFLGYGFELRDESLAEDPFTANP
jgi:hypothetical protein